MLISPGDSKEKRRSLCRRVRLFAASALMICLVCGMLCLSSCISSSEDATLPQRSAASGTDTSGGTTSEESSSSAATSSGGDTDTAAPEGEGSDTSADDPDLTDTEGASPASPDASGTENEKAASLVSAMSLEQKVAQMFIVTPEDITGVDTATRAGSTTESALSIYQVGGIIYFKKNLIDTDQTKTMIANSQTYSLEASGLPLFIAVDEEGGTVRRISGNSGFDVADIGNMADIGATGDTGQARDAAVTIGSYLSELGFNLNFAPDADICGDVATDVMAKRSFGTDANLVADMVSAQIEGFLSTGILCTAKHFPGIGGVEGDSHDQSISSEKTLDELRSWELVPFTSAIEAGVPFIMVGHLSLPNAVGNSIPASINSAVVSDLLRNELGYTGLIITDSLSMSAAEEYCSADTAGVAAIVAGVDMVLMPSDFAAAYQGVIDAVRSGDISEDRIDESVTRIVATKLQYLSGYFQ